MEVRLDGTALRVPSGEAGTAFAAAAQIFSAESLGQSSLSIGGIDITPVVLQKFPTIYSLEAMYLFCGKQRF
jgi:hypothetical protein